MTSTEKQLTTYIRLNWPRRSGLPQFMRYTIRSQVKQLRAERSLNTIKPVLSVPVTTPKDHISTALYVVTVINLILSVVLIAY